MKSLSLNINFTNFWHSSKFPLIAMLKTFLASIVVICLLWNSLTLPLGCNIIILARGLFLKASIAFSGLFCASSALPSYSCAGGKSGNALSVCFNLFTADPERPCLIKETATNTWIFGSLFETSLIVFLQIFSAIKWSPAFRNSSALSKDAFSAECSSLTI